MLKIEERINKVKSQKSAVFKFLSNLEDNISTKVPQETPVFILEYQNENKQKKAGINPPF